MKNHLDRDPLPPLVLAASPIHLRIAFDLPKWAIKELDKLHLCFLWKGQKQANGGKCLMSWAKVQRPLKCGVWPFMI
jgi:hypothetical protein